MTGFWATACCAARSFASILTTIGSISSILPSATRSAWGAPIPFAYDENGFMCILATVGSNKKVQLLVDTGMDWTISLSRSTFAAAVGANDIRVVRTVKMATVASGESVQEGILSNLTVGPFHHRNVCVNASDPDCLGIPYLKRFRVTIDFPGKTIYLAKGKRYDDREGPSDRSGLHLLRRGGRIEVHTVDQWQPCRESGNPPKGSNRAARRQTDCQVYP